MQVLFTTIVGLTGIFGPLLSIIAMNSKSGLAQIFLTDEQKLKLYYYNLFMFSLLISTLSAVLYILFFSLFAEGKIVLDSKSLGTAGGIAVIVFLFCLMFMGTLAKIVRFKYLKTHYKFKVKLPEIGEVYIIRMLNNDTCICSKYPNLEYNKGDRQ